MEKINMNKKRQELADSMSPFVFWNEGTDDQQDFANKIIENFCKRFAKYLCWGIKDNIIELVDAESFASAISLQMGNIDNAKWWCNKKNTNDFTIASNLLKEDVINLNIVKKLKKEYN